MFGGWPLVEFVTEGPDLNPTVRYWLFPPVDVKSSGGAKPHSECVCVCVCVCIYHSLEVIIVALCVLMCQDVYVSSSVRHV